MDLVHARRGVLPALDANVGQFETAKEDFGIGIQGITTSLYWLRGAGGNTASMAAATAGKQ